MVTIFVVADEAAGEEVSAAGPRGGSDGDEAPEMELAIPGTRARRRRKGEPTNVSGHAEIHVSVPA